MATHDLVVYAKQALLKAAGYRFHAVGGFHDVTARASIDRTVNIILESDAILAKEAANILRNSTGPTRCCFTQPGIAPFF